MKKFPKILASSVMALSLLAGCGSEGGNAAAAVELNEGDTVKVGLNYELSGATATYGLAMEKGSQLAIKQYNEREDRKYTIEVISQDCKSDSVEAQSIASRLMTEEGVAFQVGPATSPDSLATYPISTDAQVPVLSPAVTQNGGMLDANGEAYPYAWRVCFEDNAQASAMAVFAYENLGKRKAVVYSDSGNDYAKGLAESFIEKFESLGGEIVTTENYIQGDTDFNAVISSLTEEDHDVDQNDAVDDHADAGEVLQQHVQHTDEGCGDHAARHRAHAAEYDHDQDIDRFVEREQIRFDDIEVAGVQRTGHAGQRRTDDKRRRLVAGRIDAHRLGSDLILTDADAGTSLTAAGKIGHDDDARHHQDKQQRPCRQLGDAGTTGGPVGESPAWRSPDNHRANAVSGC